MINPQTNKLVEVLPQWDHAAARRHVRCGKLQPGPAVSAVANQLCPEGMPRGRGRNTFVTVTLEGDVTTCKVEILNPPS